LTHAPGSLPYAFDCGNNDRIGVCAFSAPSSLPVEFARESGQALVGFLRGQTMNIYSSPERVVAGADSG